MIRFSSRTSPPFHLSCKGTGLAEVDAVLAADAISATPAAYTSPMTVVTSSGNTSGFLWRWRCYRFHDGECQIRRYHSPRCAYLTPRRLHYIRWSARVMTRRKASLFELLGDSFLFRGINSMLSKRATMIGSRLGSHGLRLTCPEPHCMSCGGKAPWF